MMRRHLTARAALVLIGATLPAAVLAGCGGDDDTAGDPAGDTAATRAASTEAPSTQAPSTQPLSTEPSAGVEASVTSPGETGATGASGAASDCPPPTQVGDVVGVDLELDPLSVTGDGLGNCLYSQVGAFSDDPPPDPVLVWVS